jgi:hypothetical protein
MMAMTSLAQQQIRRLRLNQQRLSQNQLKTPEEVVAWMGAVQSQDYLGTKWALGMRMEEATDDGLEEAFNAGRILRTHVMRPTWHFVTPADIRWLVELTAPRVRAINASYHRQLGLDEATVTRSNEVIARALQGGHFRTRAELGKILEQAGIDTSGLRLGFLTHAAELETLICSGPRLGKQFTYALLAERAPQAKSLSRPQALAELARRYFTSHGPATVHDFAWWSGLTVADARAAVAMVESQLTHAEFDEQHYWFSASLADAIGSATLSVTDSAYLLPTYDEFLVGFSSLDQSRRNGGELLFDSTIVLGGEVVGSWKRTIKKESVTIELAPFAPLSRTQTKAVNRAIQRYGEFIGLAVETKTH